MLFRVVLALALAFSFSWAVEEKLRLAKEYEQRGEYQKAMEIYKSLVGSELKAENTTIVMEKNLNTYTDQRTNDSVHQALYGDFGLKPYQTNYLLPYSHSKQAKTREGTSKSEVKFQLSIQKELANNVFGYNESYSFAYTQISWWQLYADSAHFRETNYLPEFFVRVPVQNSALKAVQVGVLHESNGRGYAEERSWNRVYLKAYFQVGGLFIIPRVWQQFTVHQMNKDIRKYLGYGDLTLLYPYKENFFSVVLKNNLDFSKNRNGVEANWSFPLFNTGLFGFLQYYNGYGESLIDYNRSINRFSLGIAVSR